MNLKSKNFWSTVMIVLIVAFDQFTKYLVKLYLYGKPPVTFVKGVVEFRYAENTGVAFSMFSGGRWFFIVLTAVVSVGCLVYMYKSKTAQNNLWLFWSLGVIVSGAIGNLIDRVLLGYVVDFINPLFVKFAVFNIADSAVTLGTVSLMAYLVYDLFREKKNEQKH